MKLYLLRHGATDGNLKKQYIGSTDLPLAEVGIQQAREREKTLPAVEFVWVSSMLRARQTKAIFYPEIPFHCMDELREMDFGLCEQKTWEEINDPTIYDGWLAARPDACFPGGETLQQLQTRLSYAVEQIAEQCLREGLSSGAIVAHGGVIMGILSCYGIPHRGFFEWESCNCGGYVTDFDPVSRKFTVLEQIGGGRIW